MFKLIAIITLLVVGSYGVKISISSSGAYVARCFIDLYDDFGSLSMASGNIYAGETCDMDLPDSVVWMKIHCENQRLIDRWGHVFTQEFDGLQSLCYTIGGTAFHPSHSATIC